MKYNWAPIIGTFEQDDTGVIRFCGDEIEQQDGAKLAAIGNYICNQVFSGGRLTATIEFDDLDDHSACEIIVHYDSAGQEFITAGLGASALYAIRAFTRSSGWTVLAATGDRKNLRAGLGYTLAVDLAGTEISLRVNDVLVLTTRLPFRIPRSQVGLWCMSRSNISVKDFTVAAKRPRAFVVMQFSSTYNDVYREVIRIVCDRLEVETVRADEAVGESVLIISDIESEISRAKLVIADISPHNPNVYYELGFARALQVPTILIAEKGTKLPFDVAAFRTIFYENSIGGKPRLEEQLERNMKEILSLSSELL